MSNWEIVPYRSPAGRSPVEEYLDGLPANEAARVEVALDLLAEYGTTLGMPQVRPVSHDLWELRIRGKTQHRVLYIALRGQRFLLLHAFTKKTQATPARAIRTALDRLNDYRERSAT